MPFLAKLRWSMPFVFFALPLVSPQHTFLLSKSVSPWLSPSLLPTVIKPNGRQNGGVGSLRTYFFQRGQWQQAGHPSIHGNIPFSIDLRSIHLYNIIYFNMYVIYTILYDAEADAGEYFTISQTKFEPCCRSAGSVPSTLW